MTDMVFPYFSLLGSTPDDFDPLTVIIILTMVFISGTLRFVQESRSGNAAEKLLAMITTTCTVTRREQEKIEIPMDDLVVGDIVHLSAGDMIPCWDMLFAPESGEPRDSSSAAIVACGLLV